MKYLITSMIRYKYLNFKSLYLQRVWFVHIRYKYFHTRSEYKFIISTTKLMQIRYMFCVLFISIFSNYNEYNTHNELH